MLRPFQTRGLHAGSLALRRGNGFHGNRLITTSFPCLADVKPPAAPPIRKAEPIVKTKDVPAQNAVPVARTESSSIGSSPPKKRRRLRNFAFTLTTLIGLSFAGGVYYSLVSDNFHDFFTEYVPFGEETVRYIEEREFKKRFPTAFSKILPLDSDSRIRIGKDSGVTWSVSDKSAGAEAPNSTTAATAAPHIRGKKEPEPEKVVVSPETPAVQAQTVGEKQIPVPSDEAVLAVRNPDRKKAPKLAPVEIKDDDVPEVRHLIQHLNALVEVTSKEESGHDLNQIIASIADQVSLLRKRVSSISLSSDGAVNEDKVKEVELEYAKVTELLAQRAQKEVERAQDLIAVQTMEELQKMADGYHAKTDKLIGETQQMYEMRLKNAMLEQSKELKRRFAEQIQDVVENERNGRLGRLEELTSRLENLERLTAAWDNVVNSILKTQRLQVALDTVRAAVEDPEQPKPFLKELAALKEIAEDDELVRAAISSINPRAYQQGIATHTELIDRFRAVSEEVRKAALLPENAGVAGHAASWALSKIMFRKTGHSAGADVESILSRTELFLEEGDLDSAAREVNQLQGWAKILARDWLREVRILLEVKQALEVIGIEARLRALQAERL